MLQEMANIKRCPLAAWLITAKGHLFQGRRRIDTDMRMVLLAPTGAQGYIARVVPATGCRVG